MRLKSNYLNSCVFKQDLGPKQAISGNRPGPWRVKMPRYAAFLFEKSAASCSAAHPTPDGWRWQTCGVLPVEQRVRAHAVYG